MQRFNPFRPGNIVAPGMFSGRVDELLTLERALFQTKNGNPNHFLIHGERGIGKSSLLLYLDYVATGKFPTLKDSATFSFLTVNIELEPSITYLELIKKIGAEFQRVVASQERFKDLAKKAWDFLKRWEVAGVKYNNRNGGLEPHQLLDDLVHTVYATLEDIGDATDGVLVLIDEADKPPPEANLGEFAKLFTERLSKRGCNRVALGLAGQTEVIERLGRSHESSPRIFEMLTLNPLAPPERIEVVRKGLAEIKAKTGVEVSITPEAEKSIADLSEGYPNFIQQFAHAACEQDVDNNITIEDVNAGAFGKNGALHQLGPKYFREMYFDQIGSDEYRGVLRFMSQHGTAWVTKEQIRKALKVKDSTLTNAIAALKSRHIIISQDGHKGVYRLPTSSFAAWINAFIQDDS